MIRLAGFEVKHHPGIQYPSLCGKMETYQLSLYLVPEYNSFDRWMMTGIE